MGTKYGHRMSRDGVCEAIGCSNPVLARRLCRAHYQRKTKYGDANTRLDIRAIDRFWSRVVPGDNGCWLWTGTVAGKYGQLYVNGRPVPAHRFSYEWHIGQIPDGMLACHHCDVPLCVHPGHLFIGTVADNTADMIRKGRGSSGQRHAELIARGRLRSSALRDQP